MDCDTFLSIHKLYSCENTGHIIQIPVQIGVDTLPEELDMALSTLTQGRFLSYRLVPAADLFIYMILDKLTVYAKHSPQDSRNAGDQLIRILESIEHDNDSFPTYHIERIYEIIGGARSEIER